MIVKRQTIIRENVKDVPYLEFEDEITEISNLYSYVELSDINKISYGVHMASFEEQVQNFNLLEIEKKKSIILRLYDHLEVADRNLRVNAARAVLYLCQGCPNDTEEEMSVAEQMERAKENVMIVFAEGGLSTFQELLQGERVKRIYGKKSRLISSSDHDHIYTILNVIYLIVETMRVEKQNPQTKYKKETDQFFQEIIYTEDNMSLIIALLDMTSAFAFRKKPKYPIKKILLLLWKLLTVTLGTLEDTKDIKSRKRNEARLNLDHHKPGGGDFQFGKLSKFDFQTRLCAMQIKCFGEFPKFTDFDGLPLPVREELDCLKKHLYVPLSQIQTQTKTTLTKNETTESLYRNMLPKMHIYVCALMRIVLYNHRITIDTTENDKLNIFGEILQPNSSQICDLEPAKGHAYRQLEIVNRTVSAIILLMMKHFKLNHVYQYEFFAYNLVACESVKHFSLLLNHADRYVARRSENPLNNFPSAPQKVDILFDELSHYSMTDLNYKHSTRNLCTFVNYLRILNKLIKSKQSRIKSFMKQSSSQAFKKSLLDNPDLSYYSLKLLKAVSRFLGKKWGQTNIKVMTRIFRIIRHRLVEDWNYYGTSNNYEDEKILMQQVFLYNRRYSANLLRARVNPVKDCTIVEVPQDFENFLEAWVEEQVKSEAFDWDSILVNDETLKM